MNYYSPRLADSDKPQKGNPYYNTVSAGGYSDAIIGYPTADGLNVLSNCVGYARGRFAEALGDKSAFSLVGNTNAENIYYCSPKLEKGSKPKNGALMVFKQGNLWDGSDGCGHVLFVEKVISDTEIIVSQSAYGGKDFYTARMKNGSNGNWGYAVDKFQFVGFIYPPQELSPLGDKPYKVTISGVMEFDTEAAAKNFAAAMKALKLSADVSGGDTLQIGDRVTVKEGAKAYGNTSLQDWVYNFTFDVLGIGYNNDDSYCQIGIDGAVTAAVKISDVEKIS